MSFEPRHDISSTTRIRTHATDVSRNNGSEPRADAEPSAPLEACQALAARQAAGPRHAVNEGSPPVLGSPAPQQTRGSERDGRGGGPRRPARPHTHARHSSSSSSASRARGAGSSTADALEEAPASGAHPVPASGGGGGGGNSSRQHAGGQPGRAGPAGLGAGGQKGNANHLLRFQYEPASSTRGPSSGPGYQPGGRRQHQGGPPQRYDRKKFLQANYRFLVSDGPDPRPHQRDPDLMFDWEDVVQVELVSSSPLQCPISLDSPPLCPQITPCGHIFAFPSIMHHLINAGGEQLRRAAACPLCFAPIVARELRLLQVTLVQPIQVGSSCTFQLLRRTQGSILPQPQGPCPPPDPTSSQHLPASRQLPPATSQSTSSGPGAAGQAQGDMAAQGPSPPKPRMPDQGSGAGLQGAPDGPRPWAGAGAGPGAGAKAGSGSGSGSGSCRLGGLGPAGAGQEEVHQGRSNRFAKFVTVSSSGALPLWRQAVEGLARHMAQVMQEGPEAAMEVADLYASLDSLAARARRWAQHRAELLQERGLLAGAEGPGSEPEQLGSAMEAQVKQMFTDATQNVYLEREQVKQQATLSAAFPSLSLSAPTPSTRQPAAKPSVQPSSTQPSTVLTRVSKTANPPVGPKPPAAATPVAAPAAPAPAATPEAAAAPAAPAAAAAAAAATATLEAAAAPAPAAAAAAAAAAGGGREEAGARGGEQRGGVEVTGGEGEGCVEQSAAAIEPRQLTPSKAAEQLTGAPDSPEGTLASGGERAGSSTTSNTGSSSSSLGDGEQVLLPSACPLGAQDRAVGKGQAGEEGTAPQGAAAGVAAGAGAAGGAGGVGASSSSAAGGAGASSPAGAAGAAGGAAAGGAAGEAEGAAMVAASGVDAVRGSGSESWLTGPELFMYQAVDGQWTFLDPLCLRVLAAHWGSPDAWPPTLSAPVLELEQLEQSEAMRRKLRWLAHLPLRGTFNLAELDLTALVPASALEPFAADLAARETRRRRRAAAIKRGQLAEAAAARAAAAKMRGPDAAELAAMPKLGDASVNLPEGGVDIPGHGRTRSDAMPTPSMMASSPTTSTMSTSELDAAIAAAVSLGLGSPGQLLAEQLRAWPASRGASPPSASPSPLTTAGDTTVSFATMARLGFVATGPALGSSPPAAIVSPIGVWAARGGGGVGTSGPSAATSDDSVITPVATRPAAGASTMPGKSATPPSWAPQASEAVGKTKSAGKKGVLLFSSNAPRGRS